VRISAKADYAVRAAVTLAAVGGDVPVKAERLATEQDIPLNFLENILHQLKSSGVVTSHRGPEGGFRLARPADQVTLADIIRAVEGPLASVRGTRPEQVSYTGAAAPLQEVWIALRANLRAVLERVTLADVAAGKLPREVQALTRDEAAWKAPAFE
jgi:Rrf2 family protein